MYPLLEVFYNGAISDVSHEFSSLHAITSDSRARGQSLFLDR